MARTGMQTLIDTVRGFANAAPDEWEVTSGSSIVTYWSDDEIQRVLDRHKVEHIHAPLEPVTSYSGGSAVVCSTEQGLAILKAARYFRLRARLEL